jgi:hypothetical protein
MDRIEKKNGQKIYFICRGTNNSDVIDSINKILKSKISEASSFFSVKNKNLNNKLKSLSEIKLDKNEYVKLDDIGIRELQLCKDSSFLKPMIDLHLYTSLDYSSIESSIILLSGYILPYICPLPYMTNSNIRNIETLKTFKNKFGILKKEEIISGNIREITTTEKYWKNKKLDTNFLNIKSNEAKIDWTHINEQKISSLSSYNISNFIKLLEQICLSQYIIYNDIKYDMYTYIFVCDNILLSELLSRVKGIRFNKKKNVIERTSIWELFVDIEFKIDSLDIIKKKSFLKFSNFNKLYPIEYDYSPLKIDKNNNDSFIYMFNGNKYKLFDSFKQIPIKFLKNFTFSKLKSDDKKTAIAVLELNNKKENKIENDKNKPKNSLSKNTFSFENAL